MNILTLNSGSSSLSFKVYQHDGEDSGTILLSGKARNVATRTRAASFIEWTAGTEVTIKYCTLTNHRLAAQEVLILLEELNIKVDAIGHRFVHGGDLFHACTRVDDSSLPRLRDCLPLAPIHNPNAFSIIEACLAALPSADQFVVFDTAFHARMPKYARTYALPEDLMTRFGLYKYGFHGLSYQYVSVMAEQYLKKPLDEVKLIMCHLGTGGSSVCAFAEGRSIATSMGYSPLAGLVMSTRCGDIDAEVALELVRRGMSADEVSQTLNHKSGLIGLSGYSSNLEEVIAAAEEGNERCQLAYDVYAARLQHYLGAYTWQFGGADAIVFTDDIGTHSWKLRARALCSAAALGVLLDEEMNRKAPADQTTLISLPQSATAVLVIPTDEEKIIAEEVIASLR